MLSRRWAIFAVIVVVLGYGCYLLGRWQFHRLHDREVTNTQIRENLHADRAPVGDVLSVGRPVPADSEWRRVTAHGHYLPSRSVVIRYQTRNGQTGVDIVTPLRTDPGPALLVDRGWMRTDNVGSTSIDAPPPPAGEVTVTGWVRSDATGSAATVTDSSARAISSTEIAKTFDFPVYGGFVDVQREQPAPAKPLVPAEQPDLGNGPHFFYGLQWWFFGVLAVFGFFYFAYDERKRGRPTVPGAGPSGGSPAERAATPGSQSAEHAAARPTAGSA